MDLLSGRAEGLGRVVALLLLILLGDLSDKANVSVKLYNIC